MTDRERKMQRRQALSRGARTVRGTYFTAVFLWLCFNLLFPVWHGKSYNYYEGEERWHEGGQFGITGGGPWTTTAPLWNPPRSSGGLRSTVRLPMSPVNEQHHIEIATSLCFWRFTTGVMLAGFVAGAARWIVSRRHPTDRWDRVITAAMAVSLSLLSANLVLFALAAASMGFALIDPVVWGVLGVGIAIGIGLGLFVRQESAMAPTVEPKGDQVERDVVDTKGPAGTPVAEAGEHVQSKNNSQPKEQPALGQLQRMRRLSWWWRVPAYLIAQFLVMSCIRSLDWPTGRDVFGPYKKIPDWVYLAFWGQFIIVPFLSWRMIGFLLSELALAGIVATTARWPMITNVFGPQVLVPDWVWVIYWLQFILVALVVWKVPKFICSNLARRSN